MAGGEIGQKGELFFVLPSLDFYRAFGCVAFLGIYSYRLGAASSPPGTSTACLIFLLHSFQLYAFVRVMFVFFFSKDFQRLILTLLIVFHEANAFLMRSWDGLGCAEKWLEEMWSMNALNFEMGWGSS